MSELMNKVFKSSIFSSIGLAILGLLLIFQSEITIMSISYIVGAILVALGTLATINYVKGKETNNKKEIDIIYATVCIILGILVICNPQGIASLLPFIIGLVIIITSATKLQYGIELKRQSNSLWKTTVILSIITMLCGVLLIFNPFQGAIFITKVVGTLILVYAILDIISTLSIKRTVNKLHKSIEQHIVEADVIEETEEKETNKKEKKGKENTDDD